MNIDKKYAWARLWASVIDAILISIVTWAILLPFGLANVTNVETDYTNSSSALNQFLGAFISPDFLLSIFLFLPLAAFLESHFGVTPGKAAFKITVSDLTGKKLKFSRSLLRNILKEVILSGLMILALLVLVLIIGLVISVGSLNDEANMFVSLVMLFVILGILCVPLLIVYQTINQKGQALYDVIVGATVSSPQELIVNTDNNITSDSIQQLTQLRDKGIISNDEFESKKKIVLEKI